MESINMFLGSRVRLTAPRAGDAATMSRWHEDGWFLRLINASTARPQSESQIQAWIDETDKSDHDIVLAVRLVDTDELIGWIELTGILWNCGTTMLGIAVGDSARWDQGYGREAMELTLRYAFDELNLHRVGLTVFSYNQRAVALYEKLGFTYEGAQREFLHRGGQRHDMYYYGLLRREWETRADLDQTPATI